jgi:hypothetical protein
VADATDCCIIIRPGNQFFQLICSSSGDTHSAFPSRSQYQHDSRCYHGIDLPDVEREFPDELSQIDANYYPSRLPLRRAIYMRLTREETIPPVARLPACLSDSPQHPRNMCYLRTATNERGCKRACYPSVASCRHDLRESASSMCYNDTSRHVIL